MPDAPPPTTRDIVRRDARVILVEAGPLSQSSTAFQATRGRPRGIPRQPSGCAKLAPPGMNAPIDSFLLGRVADSSRSAHSIGISIFRMGRVAAFARGVAGPGVAAVHRGERVHFLAVAAFGAVLGHLAAG